MTTIPNASMVTGSFDRQSGTQALPIYQPLNNFRIQTTGAPIIQGQMNRLAITELMFPYSVPTIINSTGDDKVVGQNGSEYQVSDNSIFFITSTAVTLSGGGATATFSASTVVQFNVPQGFYNGSDMATLINTLITASSLPGKANLLVAWDNNNNRIRWTNTQTWTGADATPYYIFTIQPFATGSANAAVALQKPRFFWTVGLRNLSAKYPPVACVNAAQTGGQFASQALQFNLIPINFPLDGGATTPQLPIFQAGYAMNVLVGSPYSGRYTDYVDLCSTTLCANQYVRDGNTNQNIVRKDIIARIYIADEISIANDFETGSRPFEIHRQNMNPKVMKWTADRSIDAIDLTLYDMFGNPLPLTGYCYTGGGLLVTPNNANALYTLSGEMSDYAVTFHVYEPGESAQGHNVGYIM